MYLEKIVVGSFAVNCYFIMCKKTKEAIVIDPGAQGELIKRSLDKKHAKLKYIVLTHGHGDHIGAVLDLKASTGAEIIVSEDEQEMLLDPEYNQSVRICSEPIAIEADIFMRDNDTFEFGQLYGKTIKTPGHTKGGMCILIDNTLFSGDTLFKTSVGRTDLKGGNMQILISSITHKLFALADDTIVYPGHGPKSNIGYEKANNPFI